jgi:hypothetical protein
MRLQHSQRILYAQPMQHVKPHKRLDDSDVANMVELFRHWLFEVHVLENRE